MANDSESGSRTVSAHGATLRVPSDWEDFSIFRYAAPKADPEPSRFLGEITQLQPNLIATRRAVEQGTRLPEVFLDSNSELAQQNESFKVLGQGQARYLDQLCAWQDSEQVHLELEVKVFQRHVALATAAPDQIVLLTLTGTKADVERMATEMGMELS